jgi:transposase InsO family protein
MTLVQSIHRQRLRVLAAADASGNVTATCAQFGVSRTLFYRWRQDLHQYGTDGVRPKTGQPRRGRPPTLAPELERRVLALAVAWPTWGPARLSAQLRRDGVTVAPTTIWRLLRRLALGRRTQRLLVLEHHSAETAGLVTERVARRLLRLRRRRHVEADQPGDLVCLDSFYIGKLKGVGRVWQLTACDAACSFAIAQIVPAVTAAAMAAFLTQWVLPTYRRAGWRVTRVLTDGGPEFKALFGAACTVAGVRHTRIQPRHPWTNGYVERLQGTILHEHWRVVFRRHYFTSRRQLQRSLDGFLAFYNDDRPHQGHKLRGHTPGGLFWGPGGQA